LHLVGKDEVSLFDFVVERYNASDDEDHEPEICRAEYKVRRPLNCNLVSSRVFELKSYKEYIK
jgi:dTDP-4-dehydrorhamnose reductase